MSNVVIIKCVISVDVLPNPLFKQGFENIFCLSFFYIYSKVASINVKRSQYIRIENPLHKQSEKACMCFKTRRASTCNYTVSNYYSFSGRSLDRVWSCGHHCGNLACQKSTAAALLRLCIFAANAWVRLAQCGA